MNKSILLLFSFISYLSNAQTPISYVISDVSSSGQTQRIAIDTFPLPSVNFGSKGANQVYDFSNLTLFKYDTIEYRTPTSGQLSTCPSADVATTADGINFLLTNTDNTNNKLTLEGFEGQLIPGSTLSAAYSTKPDLFRFPTNYLSSFGGTAALTKTVPGSQVGQPVSQVRLTINTTYTDTIDGWGKVITPMGAYKCLRKQRKETTTTLIEAQIFPPIWTTVSNTTNTTIRYSYITKEAKGSVINFNYDTANVLQSVNWSMVPPEAPVADFTWQNPSGGLVSFTDQSTNYPTSWLWNFGDGSSNSTVQNPNHTFTANNTYNVCLTATNAGGSNQVCKNVLVSGIVAGNSAPVAVDDTFSVLQATSVVKLVAGNDLDPNGDSVCIANVWGTSSAIINAGIPCTDIYYLSDTCYTGNQIFYYSICDNGSPVLCDTAMVTVTVIQNSSYFTQAYFDISMLTHDCMTMSIPNSSSNYTNSIWTLDDFISVDSNSYTTVSLTNAPFDNMDFNGEICLTTTGKCNTDNFCDTTAILCSGIKETSISDITISPNPTSNMLNVNMTNSSDGITSNYASIGIVNVMGQQVVILESSNERLVNINTSALAPGSYYAIINGTDGTRRTLGRFVITR